MQEKTLGETIINNAIVADYGGLQQVIYDENKNAIFGNVPNGKATFKGKAQFIDEKVVLLGFLNAHHGHLITDELGKFWWILKNGTKKHKFIYFCIKNGKSISAFEALLFEIFGLNDKNSIRITKPMQFRAIILPDNSFHSQNGIEIERQMIDFITSKITPIKNDALYLSRRKFSKSTALEFGEEYFEEIYAKKGYQIIYPETLSPKEQLALWGGAHKFAAVGGTLPHNMIFAPYGSELEIILKTSQYKDDNPCTFNQYQAIVNKIKNLQVKRIHAYIEDLPGICWGRGPFLMLPNDSLLDLDLLNKIKKDVMSYLMEYKKALMKNKLEKKPHLNELKQGFCAFKNKIKRVDFGLCESLQSEFEKFDKWVEFYFSHPKLALLFYRIKKLPYQLVKDIKRPFQRLFK